MSLDLFDKIEATPSTNAKLAILKEAALHPECRFLISSALNYQRLYYIKDLPEIEGTGKYAPDWIVGFAKLLDTCEVSGRTQATKAIVLDWLLVQAPQVTKWARRVILRDLRSGFGVELANRAGFNVPEFEVQLATDGKQCKKLDKLLPGLCGPKLDGYRCFAIYEGGTTRLLSRNGNVFENFPTINAAVTELAQKEGWATLILDGEIMSDTFNDMQKSAFASKRGTTVGDVTYKVFDCVPHAEFVAGEFQVPYEMRYKTLEHLLQGNSDPRIALVEHVPVATEEEILYLERTYMERGYEGAMFKPNIPYYFGKSKNKMLKFKTMVSQDCYVTGMFEGRSGTKYVGMMGGLTVIQENGVACEVGSGFDDDQRAEFWGQDLTGRVVEIKYQELTPDGVMRFPIFQRFREDKGPNDNQVPKE